MNVSTTHLLPILTLISWGLWATVLKFASAETSPVAIAILINVVSLPLFVMYGLSTDQQLLTTDTYALMIILLAGVFSAVGTLSYYTALSKGLETSVVTTITAMYFIVPAVLAFFVLSESLSTQEILGVLAAIAATILLNS